MKIMVLIPAFNEADGINGVISAIRSTVPNYDIVVVNDGSDDATASVAQAAGAEVITHPFNMGYGVAIQTGYKYALAHNYDALVQIDGDGQHDPTCIPRLLEPVVACETDFSLGSRFLDEGSYRPELFRSLGMTLFRLMVSLKTGRRITDSTSGYQAFNRNVVEFFTHDAFPNDYPDADVLITLHLAGFSIREVPVRMYANPGGISMHSGLKPFYYIFKMLLSIAAILLQGRQHWR